MATKLAPHQPLNTITGHHDAFAMQDIIQHHPYHDIKNHRLVQHKAALVLIIIINYCDSRAESDGTLPLVNQWFGVDVRISSPRLRNANDYENT